MSVEYMVVVQRQNDVPRAIKKDGAQGFSLEETEQYLADHHWRRVESTTATPRHWGKKYSNDQAFVVLLESV